MKGYWSLWVDSFSPAAFDNAPMLALERCGPRSSEASDLGLRVLGLRA